MAVFQIKNRSHRITPLDSRGFKCLIYHCKNMDIRDLEVIELTHVR